MTDAIKTLIDANDRRYAELREADQKAITNALAAQEKAVAAALAAAERAVLKAEASSDKRFEGVNEFRATLSDQAMRLMPRAECELRLKSLEDSQQKRLGMGHLWGILIGVVGILALLYSTLFK